MEKNNKNIDHFFKEELGGYTEVPPPAAWEALEKKLQATSPPGGSPPAFRKYGYIAMLTLVVSFSAVIIARRMTANPTEQNAQDNALTATEDAAPATEAPAQLNNNTNKPAYTPAQKETEPAVANNASAADNIDKTPAEGTPAIATAAATPVNGAQADQRSAIPAKNHVSPTLQAAANIVKPTTSPFYALSGTSHKAPGHLPAPVALKNTKDNKPPADVSKQAIPGTHEQTSNSETFAANNNQQAVAANEAATPHYPVTGVLSNPAPADNTEEIIPVPAAMKQSQPAHEQASSISAAKNTGKIQEEEIASLNTALKHVGITNSAAPINEKIVPQANAPVYNNTLNAPYLNNYSTGGAQAAGQPAKTAINELPATVKTIPNAKAGFNRFEAGIKAGFEKGFTYNTAAKLLAAPYLQYNLSPRLAIMVQPAVKAAKVASKAIGNAQSYYKVNNDGTTTLADSTPLYIPTGGSADTMWLRNYSYTQTHDSIVKTNTYGGTYIEAELPVLLKFYVTPRFSVYGGANIAYGRLTGVTEHTYTSAGITQTGTAITVAQQHIAPPVPAALNTVITYTGTSYADYTGPQYPAVKGGALRLGYMAGFSYQFSGKWLFDGLIQQGMAKPDVQAGYNTNTAISAPYFRFTIGYKLTK